MKHHVQQITEKINLRTQFPKIYLGIGPCRSGTTAFLQVFANAGVQSWYQPIKTMLRASMNQHLDYNFEIPATQSIFVKETIGAGTELESQLNPLELLLFAGVPPKKIELIVFFRDPIAVMASWKEFVRENLSTEKLVELLALSYQTTGQIYQQAKKLNIRRHSFVYESLRENPPLKVQENFLNNLNLPDTSNIIWKSVEYEQSIGRIVFLEQAQKYQVEGLHDKFKQSRQLKYFVRSIEETRKLVSVENVELLRASGAFSIYSDFRELCQRELELKIDKAVFDFFQ